MTKKFSWTSVKVTHMFIARFYTVVQAVNRCTVRLSRVYQDRIRLKILK